MFYVLNRIFLQRDSNEYPKQLFLCGTDKNHLSNIIKYAPYLLIRYNDNFMRMRKAKVKVKAKVTQLIQSLSKVEASELSILPSSSSN